MNLLSTSNEELRTNLEQTTNYLLDVEEKCQEA